MCQRHLNLLQACLSPCSPCMSLATLPTWLSKWEALTPPVFSVLPIKDPVSFQVLYILNPYIGLSFTSCSSFPRPLCCPGLHDFFLDQPLLRFSASKLAFSCLVSTKSPRSLLASVQPCHSPAFRLVVSCVCLDRILGQHKKPFMAPVLQDQAATSQAWSVPENSKDHCKG